MFKVKEIVKPSGKGRTARWNAEDKNLCGTVTRVLENSVIVQWHGLAVEDEMRLGELVLTGEFADKVSCNYLLLGTNNEGETDENKLLTIVDDE